MSNEQSNLVKLGGLWLGKTKAGKAYMGGNLGATARMLVFKNEHKKPGDNSPDYVVYLAQRQTEPKTEQDQGDNIPW